MIRIVLFLLLTNTYVAPSIALESDRNQPATVDAENIEIDVSKGIWKYSGKVTIRQGSLYMNADEIQLIFEDNVLQKALAYGNPAIFEQQPEGSDHLIKGMAEIIEIDEIEDIATFSGNAKLQQHLNTIIGDTIIYYIRTEKISVRGSGSLKSRTERLSTISVGSSEDYGSNEVNRPKLVIQPTSNNLSLQSSVPSIVDPQSKEVNQKNSTTEINEKMTNNGEEVVAFVPSRVAKSNVRVKAKPQNTATVLGDLSKNTPVKILTIEKGWARISIPNGISVWVAESYTRNVGDNQAIITGSRVRARWLPSVNSYVVGFFEPQERVQMISTKDSWIQVVLPPSIPAWIPVSSLEVLEEKTKAWKDDWATFSNIPRKPEN
ncbi:MAG: lipopolysaccharide transport periplasmic protein LptA [Acidiferrobacteraceae bacterium]|nr:lipopolysaccharide transport periplasmic protein LptA [Acidiferrobacteraceae bacterium]